MKNYNKIEDIVNSYLEEEGEEYDNCFSGGVTEERIEKVEKVLGVKFPISYKWF